MGIKIHTSQLPPLFCAALGAALVLLVGGGAWWQFLAKTETHWAEVYGNGLAALAAQSAIDATLNQDLVSLQVVLQDVVQSPYVDFATIHDVENNLLVQAGGAQVRHKHSGVTAYSAPISFQQSIAGYLTVNLIPIERSLTLLWVLLGAEGLLLLIALLSLADAWGRVIEVAEPKQLEDETLELEDILLPLNERDTQTFVVKATAQVVLQLRDYPKLMQTLSVGLAEQLKNDLWAVADIAVDVYGGQWAKSPEVTLEQGALSVLFPSAQSADDAMRTAAFFAYVVKAAYHPKKIKTVVDAVIGMQDEICALTRRPVSSFALYVPLVEQHRLLAERINFTQLDEHWYELLDFDQAYQKLLDEQVQQIVQQ